MLEKLKDFFLKKFAGKLLARGAVAVAAYLSSGPVAHALSQAGVSVSIDPDTLGAAFMLGATWISETIKHKIAPQSEK